MIAGKYSGRGQWIQPKSTLIIQNLLVCSNWSIHLVCLRLSSLKLYWRRIGLWITRNASISSMRHWYSGNRVKYAKVMNIQGVGKNSNISLKNVRRNCNTHSLIIVTSQFIEIDFTLDLWTYLASNKEYDKHCDDWSRISIYYPLKNEWHRRNKLDSENT